MKLITRDTDYAVRSLCYIAKYAERVISVDELVKCMKIPRPFLRKILQKLCKARLLDSRKGKGGGFTLVKRPNEIRVIDLIEIFQGPVRLSEHVFKKKLCPSIKSCALKKKLDVIENYMISELGRITIGSLVKGITGKI